MSSILNMFFQNISVNVAQSFYSYFVHVAISEGATLQKFAAAAVREKSVSLPHIIDMPVSLMPPHTDITDRL